MSDLRTRLVNRYIEAQHAKRMVDVSEIASNPDAKLPIKDKPKTLRGSKKYLLDIWVMSDNYPSYLLAMELLGEDFVPYAEDYRERFGEGNVKRTIETKQIKVRDMIPDSNFIPEAAAKEKIIKAYNDVYDTPDKVLDVSNIRTDGKEWRTINEPKRESSKKYIQGVPVVSDNYEAYEFVMKVLGEKFLPYADEYRRLYKEKATVSVPKAPKTALPEKVVEEKSLYDLIVDKYNEAYNKKKLLDVSNLTADGNGMNIIDVPEDNSDIKWLEGVPVASNNYNNYAAVMEILGENFHPFADEYHQLYENVV